MGEQLNVIKDSVFQVVPNRSVCHSAEVTYYYMESRISLKIYFTILESNIPRQIVPLEFRAVFLAHSTK